MIPQYRPIYTPVHVHLVCGSILFPSSGGNSLVAKLSSGEPGVVGSSPGVSTSPLTLYIIETHAPHLIVGYSTTWLRRMDLL